MDFFFAKLVFEMPMPSGLTDNVLQLGQEHLWKAQFTTTTQTRTTDVTYGTNFKTPCNPTTVKNPKSNEQRTTVTITEQPESQRDYHRTVYLLDTTQLQSKFNRTLCLQNKSIQRLMH
uniref:(northern house mosquito) hypothetical protein n=1 Tax=Culex pipiens TaxID=7175 RepID=A0A8D8ANB6_CULPI